MKYSKYLLILAVCFAGCGNKTNQEKPSNETKKERNVEFKKIDPKEIPGNIIEMIADEWMLITAGNKESYNTMTAGWGGLGNLWGKPAATCYIHPDRYTFGFMEKGEYYTLCFFDEEYRQALAFCGSKSGRDFQDKNKAEEAGLTPAYTENGTVYFKEAYLVLECKKMYSDHFRKESFATDIVMENRIGEKSIYNERETYHKFYMGEIINCLIR
jgi:flavin reductase (DIM6/NTAB) family NADH-FMN oxidoreductase RutF